MHSFNPFDAAYFPFAQLMHVVAPWKLVSPASQGLHDVVGVVESPVHPAGQAAKLEQALSVQFVKNDPAGTVTEVVPPRTIVPFFASVHAVFPSFCCSHPDGQETHALVPL